MGMEGADVANLLAQLGVSGINAWAAPDGQELQSFEGNTALDPKNMYGEARAQTNDMISLLKTRANRPVSTRSGYVQQPPVMTGGGLPMPIGVSGMDPALADRSLLSLPGLSGVNVDSTPRDRTNPPGTGQPPPIIPDPTDPNSPAPDTTPGDESGPYDEPRMLNPRGSGPMRRTLPGQSLFASPNVSEHDDLGQGAGAMEVYLRTLAGM